MEENEDKSDMAEDKAEAGRGGDTVLAHLSLGELVIPRSFLDDPDVMEQMKSLFGDAGEDINRYLVGDKANSINPETGNPEFFSLKKIFKVAAPIALSYFGTPLLGSALGGGFAGSLGAGAIIGGASGALTGGNILKSAALGGLGGALNSAVSGGLDNTAFGRGVSDLYNGSGLQDLYTGASGALNNASSGISDLYNGSALQSGFKSGGDALKSIGIDTGSAASSTTPTALGGGPSAYSNAPDSILGKDFKLGTADFGNSALNSATNASPFNTSSALNSATTGATSVAGNNYASPLLSAAFGTVANDKAAKSLLEQQRNNQALLSPYSQGFNFSPGDLTQDPGFKFNLEQGQQALDRRQLAGGNFFSGQAGKELQTFGQGLADNTYNSAFNRALQGFNTGLGGAQAAAGVNDNIGNIKANSATNTGNLYSGALGALLGGNSYTNTGALQGGINIQDLLRRQALGASSYGGGIF